MFLAVLVLLFSFQLSQPPLFEKYETASGLSNNIVYDIFQDSKGFIWVATENGLNKFDGYEFEVFRNDANDSTSISANIVRSIVEDSKGNLWIGTYNGLNKFNRRTKSFERITEIPGDNASKLDTQSLMVDANDDVWFLHVDHALRYQPDTRVFTKFYIRSGVGRLFQGPKGRVMIQTFNGDSRSLFVIEEDDSIVEHALPLKSGSSFIHVNHEKGNTWVSDQEEGSHFSNSHLLPKFPDRTITAVLEGEKGKVWIGTDNGLFAYEHGDMSEVALGTDSNQLSKSIKTLFEDSWGGIWVGTLEGVYHFDPFKKTFSHIGTEGNAVMSLYSSSEELLIGSLSDGLLSYSTVNGEMSSIPGLARLDVRQVWDMYEGEDSAMLWLGTDRGLIRLNKQSGQAVKIELALSNVGDPVIFSIISADENSIWVAGDEAVYRVNRGSSRAVEEINLKELPNLSTAQSLYLLNQKLLIGTEGLGLFIYDTSSKELTRFEGSRAIDNAPVWTIFKDSGGRIWLGTGSGLFHVNESLDKATLVSDGGVIIYSLLEDEQNGLFWIGTDRGLASYNHSSKRLRFFGSEDGLLNNEFNRRSALKTANGDFFFGGTRGITHFNKKDVTDNPHTPLVYINQIEVAMDDEQEVVIQANRPLDLKWNQNTLEFKYVGLNYTNPKQISYEYRLKNYDVGWRIGNGTRTVRYPKIQPGEYTFEVRAANSDGVWNYSGASINISIRSPFWKTWWAYLMYTLSGLLGIWGFMKYRTRSLEMDREKLERVVSERTNALIEQKELALMAKKKIEEQASQLKELDEMKSRFFANISHELRTPLTLIQAPVKEMLSEWTEQVSPEKARSQLKLIERNSERLKSLIEELLDLSRLKQETLLIDAKPVDLNKWFVLFLEPYQSLAALKGIRLKLEHELAHTSSLVLDIDKFEKILSNLVTNALKFTPKKGQISIASAFKGGMLRVEVCDTGVGISEKEQNKIFDRFYQGKETSQLSEEGLGLGLALSKEMTELMAGSLSVESKVGEGSTFILELPVQEFEPVTMNDEEKYVDEHIEEASAPLSPELSVLIAEDNDEMRAYIGSLLGSQLKVHSAANGKEALDMVTKVSPNLIISDVMMPVMDGFELSKALRNSTDYAQIPILMLTARAADEDKLEGLRIGVDDYLIKPFIPMELKTRAVNLARNHSNRLEWITRYRSEDEIEIPLDKELEEIQSVISDHLKDVDLNVAKIAKELHSSLRQTYRNIQALTGMTPVEYINSLRLSKARELLRSSPHLTIEGIATEVGFKSRSYFSKLFKKHYGISPSEYSKGS